MIIRTVKHRNKWMTQITQGNQQFHVDFFGDATASQDEAKFMARMFRKTIKNHDAEIIEKYRATHRD